MCEVLYCYNLIFHLDQYLHSVWTKRFGEEVDEDLIYVVSVERVLQLEDFKEVFWCFICSCAGLVIISNSYLRYWYGLIL